jgi:hypothetical protein
MDQSGPFGSLRHFLNARLIFRIYVGKHDAVYVRTPQSRCAGWVNVRSAPILKLAKSINAVPTGGGGSRYELTGPGGPEEGSGFDYTAYVFVFPASSFCPLYKLTLSGQAQITLQLRVSLSHLVQRVSTGRPLLGARKTRCWRLWISFQFYALVSMSQGESLYYPPDRSLGRYIRHGEQKHSSLAGNQTEFSSLQPATSLSQLSGQVMSFSHGIIMAVTPNKASLSHWREEIVIL